MWLRQDPEKQCLRLRVSVSSSTSFGAAAIDNISLCAPTGALGTALQLSIHT